MGAGDPSPAWETCLACRRRRGCVKLTAGLRPVAVEQTATAAMAAAVTAAAFWIRTVSRTSTATTTISSSRAMAAADAWKTTNMFSRPLPMDQFSPAGTTRLCQRVVENMEGVVVAATSRRRRLRAGASELTTDTGRIARRRPRPFLTNSALAAGMIARWRPRDTTREAGVTSHAKLQGRQHTFRRCGSLSNYWNMKINRPKWLLENPKKWLRESWVAKLTKRVLSKARINV